MTAQQTLAQAEARHAALDSEHDRLTAENARLTAELATAKQQRFGNQPLAIHTESDEASGTATEQWMTLLNAKLAAGIPRLKAVAQLAKSHPELRAAMVEEANAR